MLNLVHLVGLRDNSEICKAGLCVCPGGCSQRESDHGSSLMGLKFYLEEADHEMHLRAGLLALASCCCGYTLFLSDILGAALCPHAFPSTVD